MTCSKCKKEYPILITIRCGSNWEVSICGWCFKELKKWLKLKAKGGELK